jgi:GT2 family glycosyltransferase
VNHNGRAYLGRTLEAVGRLGASVEEVLLIDSGSTDGGVTLVRERFPRVGVIELGENRGPAAARNTAIREVKHGRVLLIDNDTQPQPGCVEALVAALDLHSNAIMAMPAIVYEDAPDTVQYCGAQPHFLGAPALLHADSPLARLDDTVRAVGTAITCCVLVDRARFGDRPWFDETVFFYLEDHEFGLRASLQGFDCLIVPTARCLHGAGTAGVSIRRTGRFTPVRVRYTIRNRWLTVLMLYQKRTLLRFAPALAAFELFQLLGAVRKGWLVHWLWAVGSAARALPHVLRKRRAMHAARRRADLDVLVGGPFPYNKAMHRSALERTAQRALDTIARLNWSVAGRRRSP